MNPLILTIDGKTVAASAGQTILAAAGQAGVSIPHLCTSPGLEPFGACRLCLVEVEGLRGFLTACTTPITDGMVVHTQTPEIQALRRETLQLILSEHPSNCLLCEEARDCGLYMATTRKGDAVTGCRSCPKDGQCELQEVVAQAGLSEVNLPYHYRGLPVEKYDPFYDRDYNLCILCGRCVRVCQEVRLADVLTFKQRGPATLIGPAFDRSHLEAGCEFCGDCVAACPTGALAEKTLKWAGKPEKEVLTTCPLCSLGCQVRLLVSRDEVMGALPVDQSQLCVKGRFAAYELLNNPDRLKHPLSRQMGNSKKIGWDEAITLAAEKLSACEPGRFGMRVSPDGTNEDLFVAQKFTRRVMHSENLTTLAPEFYGPGLDAYRRLMQNTGQLASLQTASTILSIGLEGRFGWSVVALELKRAVRRGTSLTSFFPREHHLSHFATQWLPLDGPALADALRVLVRLTENNDSDRSPADPIDQPGSGLSTESNSVLASLAHSLAEDHASVIVLGPEYLGDPASPQILTALTILARQSGAIILPLAPQGNLAGAFRLLENSGRLPFPSSLDVLYLMGDTPSPTDPASGFLIYQNFSSYTGPRLPDLSLPSAAFAEVDGTTFNLEGSVRQVNKAVDPPGEALPDWLILCRIAQRMGFTGFDYPDVSAIQREMLQAMELHPGAQDGLYKVQENMEINITESCDLRNSPLSRDAYKGFPLTTWVEGLRILSFGS